MMNYHLALVMTDDPHSLRVLEQTLLQYKFRIVICSNRNDAVTYLNALRPALAVLDLQLPGCFDILMHTNLQSARLIILTADVVCAHLTGRQADAELLQPISAQDIADALHQMPEFAQLRGS